MFFLNKKDIVGVDIGSHSIKLVQLRREKSGWHLVNLGMAQLPPETIVDNTIMDSGAVVECLRNLAESQGLKTKNVASAVSGNSVIIRKIKMPTMTEVEAEAAIEWEAEQYIPFEIAEVNLDFQILGPDSQDPSNMDVVLVAAKKDFVNEYVAVFDEAGFSPLIMDIDCFALENAYQANYDQDEEVVALVNVGASSMNINILKNGTSVFTRDIQIGGNTFNQEIQKKLGLTGLEAEKVKLGASLPDVDSADIDNVLKETMDHLSQEIQRSLDFYSATSSDDRIQRVYLSGGVAKTAGCVESLQQRLGVDVELLDPFRQIHVDEKHFDMEFIHAVSPFFALGVGLATRRLGDK
ncbi:type IV pilus assembly protein PilM [Syntrophotalea acetylenica]|jgi:type IV pilus assembly protein PilM|uniref:Pilus assembly protein PilM n=1 Tax=Syntrophotalea acetylenica TaxID=29542 RepID=A0A1L3GHR1_SYNAC|nr:type IV pilus assembly protein PilM [Syntrophotalea acetylenica]APG25405.1 pilus assembly protein PilM [Syntrophotalea acetylenica]APG43473.1 pilus assembly protein PilM [Syntrophotalea acetylenica]